VEIQKLPSELSVTILFYATSCDDACRQLGLSCVHTNYNTVGLPFWSLCDIQRILWDKKWSSSVCFL